MTTPAHKKPIENHDIPSSSDVDASDVWSAWDSVFHSFKAKFRTHAAVVASDFQLSLKAIVVTLISIVTLVCLGMVIWVILLTGLTYGLITLGLHWLWCMLIIIILNIIALTVIKGVFTTALKSVEMKASADLIFHSGEKYNSSEKHKQE